MNYSIGRTPAIDEIIIEALVIPIIFPDANPLDVLEHIRYTIEQVLDRTLPPEDKSETSKYYESLSPSLLKAALQVINQRISYANALDEYLEVLYRENVGTDSGLTLHTHRIRNRRGPAPGFLILFPLSFSRVSLVAGATTWLAGR